MIQVEVRGAEPLEDHGGPQLQGAAHRRRQLGRAPAVHQQVDLANGLSPFTAEKPVADVAADDERPKP